MDLSPVLVKRVGYFFGFMVLLFVLWKFVIPPYNEPKFAEISNNETGFLVPMDESPDKQARFESAQYLKEKKVLAKRVQIVRRWVQKGWLYNTGEYIDTYRLIKVDRTPLIREWAKDPEPGTPISDDAVTAQSKDGTSIRLSITCTAFIPESSDDTPEGSEQFLYYYRGESLANIMDQEVRARCQAIASEFCAQHPLDTLRGTQHELMQAVKEDVIPFFKKRGISITNIGLVGGFHYVNRDIQAAIDSSIKAQQLKVSAQAFQEKEKVEQQTKMLNQEIDNKTLKLNAEGKAAAKLAELEGEATANLAAIRINSEAVKVKADAEAMQVRIAADAEAYRLEQLSKNKDLALAFKQIDLERAWRTQWTGQLPSTFISGMSGVPLFNMPPVFEQKK